MLHDPEEVLADATPWAVVALSAERNRLKKQLARPMSLARWTAINEARLYIECLLGKLGHEVD